jgi:hypothetical protein
VNQESQKFDNMLDPETSLYYDSILDIGDPMVNNPDHYTVGGFEAIDVIRAKLTPEEYQGYLKGTVLKYLMRSNYKGHHDQDIAKAYWFIEELVYGTKKTDPS